jgi:hypothetical protein
MGNYGRSVLDTIGTSLRASADGRPEYKIGGVSIAWSKVADVASADVSLEDGIIVAIGDSYLRYGQVICEITQVEVVPIDLSADDDPTGGTFTLTVGSFGTTGDLAWNISAADLKTALEVLVGSGNVSSVTKSGFVYTVTFAPALGNVGTITGDVTDLTGGVGDTFAITATPSTQGDAYAGWYGPYDPDATDGRQTLTRGKCFIVDSTVRESDGASDHPPVFDGGRVWKARMVATSGTHTLAAGPTYTELEAAFPRLSYAA